MNMSIILCPECAMVHEPEFPHCWESEFWKVSFERKNGRPPRLSDSMTHCTPLIVRAFVAAIRFQAEHEEHESVRAIAKKTFAELVSDLGVRPMGKILQ